jgi:hypothetical protein
VNQSKTTGDAGGLCSGSVGQSNKWLGRYHCSKESHVVNDCWAIYMLKSPHRRVSSWSARVARGVAIAQRRASLIPMKGLEMMIMTVTSVSPMSPRGRRSESSLLSPERHRRQPARHLTCRPRTTFHCLSAVSHQRQNCKCAGNRIENCSG